MPATTRARLGLPGADPQLAARLSATYSSLQHAPPIGADTPVHVAAAVSWEGSVLLARMQVAVDKAVVFQVSQVAESNSDQGLASPIMFRIPRYERVLWCFWL